MAYPSVFSFTITVSQDAIDAYGHVNNVIYLQWMQDAAQRHPESISDYVQPDDTGWYVRETRIEYLQPGFLGDEIEARTWISELKRVRAVRKYEFIRKSDGKTLVRGETQWVFVELSTGRPRPIPAEIIAVFPILADSA